MGFVKYVGLLIAWILRIFLVVTSIYYVYIGDVISAIIMLLSFAFALVPVIIKRVYNIELHWVYDVFFSATIAGHMIGYVGMYERSLIYDDFLHILSSFVLGVIGFSIIFAFDYSKKIRVTATFIMLFTILWTIGFGALWEIIEFMWDNIILLSAEYGFAQDSLLDTMMDLSWDFISGVLASLVMVSFVRRTSKATKDKVFLPIVKLFSGKPVEI